MQMPQQLFVQWRERREMPPGSRPHLPVCQGALRVGQGLQDARARGPLRGACRLALIQASEGAWVCSRPRRPWVSSSVNRRSASVRSRVSPWSWSSFQTHSRDRNTARATFGQDLAVSAFPRYVPVEPQP
jgi:hypothetical protein